MSKKNIGDYKLIKQIGQGPLGTVYLAEHRFLKRPYALKILPEELASDRGFIQRFEKEVSALASLEHPHIVKMHNVSFAEGQYFLVSDCIVDDVGETTNLAQYLARVEKNLSEEKLTQIARQIASALEYAHQKQISDEPCVHRGIKLNNILISKAKDGGMHVSLSDFGLSKVVGTGIILSRTYKMMAEFLGIPPSYLGALVNPEKATAAQVDAAKLSKLHLSFLQNYSFLAPEQKVYKESAPLDGKTDIYSYGVLLYYLIQRQFPEGVFSLPSPQELGYQHRWDRFIMQCLQNDPAKRPASLMTALDQLLSGQDHKMKEEGDLKPVLRPQEIARPEFEDDPGAIFHVETAVGRYQPKPIEPKEVNPLLTEMVVIHGGGFERGSNHGARDEMPRHHVTLSSFAIDIHPVTNEQFVRFLDAMGGEKDVNNNDIIRLRESRIKRTAGKLNIESGYAKHPIVGVTWYGAVAYAKWVGKRLPTEAEWEIAASTGSEEATYPTGGDIERSQANYFSADTTAVGSYPPNDLGLHDMAGNVYEWCQDWYDYHYYDISVQEPDNPQGPLQGVYRILRGGCWKSLKEDLRCAHRHRNNPGTMNGTYGFRCAADVS